MWRRNSRDRLDTLSRDGYDQRALEELFRICLPEDDAGGSTLKVAQAVFITIVGLAAGWGVVVCLLLAPGLDSPGTAWNE